MEHVYDFYKPDFTSEYPYVDGHFSLACYVKALDQAYAAYSKKVLKSGVEGVSDKTVGAVKRFDYNAFHVPTCKLVVKSYARLLYNDFRENPSLYPEIDSKLAELSYEESLTDKTVEKTFVSLAKELTKERVQPSLEVATNTGNLYTGSLWASLASLIYYVGNEKLQDKRVGLFSYGSGLAASLFSVVIKGDVSNIAKKLNFDQVLSSRKFASPEEYEAALALREKAHLQKGFKPSGSIDELVSGAYYLTEVDERFHRKYAIKE